MHRNLKVKVLYLESRAGHFTVDEACHYMRLQTGFAFSRNYQPLIERITDDGEGQR